jgi:hypothetical protein
MSKYKFSNPNDAAPQRGEVHPIMRGISCIMIVLVPILSYIASSLLIGRGFGKQVIPPKWYGTIEFPPILTGLTGPLGGVFRYLSSINHLPANLVLTVVMVVVVGGLISVVYGYIYEVFGPPKYGPTDEPPIRKKVKRYKR